MQDVWASRTLSSAHSRDFVQSQVIRAHRKTHLFVTIYHWRTISATYLEPSHPRQPRSTPVTETKPYYSIKDARANLRFAFETPRDQDKYFFSVATRSGNNANSRTDPPKTPSPTFFYPSQSSTMSHNEYYIITDLKGLSHVYMEEFIESLGRSITICDTLDSDYAWITKGTELWQSCIRMLLFTRA